MFIKILAVLLSSGNLLLAHDSWQISGEKALEPAQ